MNSLRVTAVAIVSTVAFGTVALSVAPSLADEDTGTVPCSDQQAQYDRATAKLAELTAKFVEHPTKHNQKVKKAQVQRVDRSKSRLDVCLAGATTEPTEPADD